MIVIVLRSSRTCHNMNVRLCEIHFMSSLFTQHDIVNPRAVRRRPTIASKMTILTPSQGGSKSGHFDPILGGWCYTKQCKFWRVSSVLIQGDSHFSGFRGGQNRPFSTPPGKGQNRPKSDIFDPPGWTMPDTRFDRIPTDLWQSHEDDNG
jgi:hypothetical protein